MEFIAAEVKVDRDEPVWTVVLQRKFQLATSCDGLGVNDRSQAANDVWSSASLFRRDAIAVGNICERYADVRDIYMDTNLDQTRIIREFLIGVRWPEVILSEDIPELNKCLRRRFGL